ncbi:SDR family oxidoreductase [Zeaxanthinibacter sp. PT1]|uniref:SDR family oxidoreductase n=1 Tax=Zeaxanthinibacter TaxID=561554 RepID=UPI00234BC822|nr:SDR family oxidoreductase [Zeaxanthinibacter sp. PT1]MDC6350244.1 SDR family oxidoreductase [Zeaxanthinibacter sp. PT1]
MSKEKQKILVAGATGTTGNIVVNLLKDSANYQPIAMVRKEEQKKDFEKNNIQVVLADLEQEVSHAVQGVDKIIFAAGSGGEKVVEVDQEGAKKLTEAGKKEGIKKFVMLSSMGADEPARHVKLKDYLEAKRNADEYLRGSELPYTIVRPGALTNDDASGQIKLETKLAEKGKIPRADVAKALVTVLEDNVRKGETFEILQGNTPIEKALRGERY